MASANIKNQDNLKIRVVSNWAVSNDKTIYDTISVKTYGDCELVEDVSVDSTVCMESCIQLEQNTNETCTLTLNSISPSQKFYSLHLVSGSKYVEIYTGPLYEYYDTFKAELYDEFEDTLIYEVKVNFKEPILQCMLKFINIATPQSLWIYGLRLTAKVNNKSDGLDQNLEARSDKNAHIKMPESINSSHCMEGQLLTMNTATLLLRSMKEYMDNKFADLEIRILEKLCDIEKNQSKLNKAIENLEKIIISNKIDEEESAT
ncbi:uncharacterized protein LOC113377548 isoform X2 [Ctenocephalides felis]|uniref:uncharacterized protein LOC113364067 isoform X2 n=1 Tax=Ctenocephalides felis TaxID=7515 RepID=UPI000E6E18F1|nr:uncharacterized protein LOC113364067 isoform X2 [Ctenocephalides felis]XP_026473691.1 uncharacterized protein LOC113377548 isoform X2 [Ctenocephalides felis]